MSHPCSDGTGVKEYVQLLASVYTELVESKMAGQIEAEISGRDRGFRDQGPSLP
ncbi:hypothetical protein ABNC51_19440 [Paenibacillus larvae]